MWTVFFIIHQLLRSIMKNSGWETKATSSRRVSIDRNRDISVSGQNCLPLPTKLESKNLHGDSRAHGPGD